MVFPYAWDRDEGHLILSVELLMPQPPLRSNVAPWLRSSNRIQTEAMPSMSLGLDLEKWAPLLPPPELSTPSGISSSVSFQPTECKFSYADAGNLVENNRGLCTVGLQGTVCCRFREPGGSGTAREWLRESWRMVYSLHETHLSITRQWSSFPSRQEQGHWASELMERWSHNLEAVESLPTGLAPLNGQMGQNCPQAWHSSFGLLFLRLKKITII